MPAFAEPPTAPKLAFVSGDNVTFRVEGKTATAHVLLRNTGLDSKSATFRVVLSDGTEKSVTPASLAVDAGQVVRSDLTIDVGSNDKTTGRLVVDDSGTTDEPAVTAITLERHARPILLVLPILLGLALGGLLIGLRIFFLESSVTPDGWKTPLLSADGKWKFTDSWASNITALGAIIGTVLGATGYVTDRFAQFSISEFLGLNLLFGALVLLAPVVYLALRTTKESVVYGTYGGLLCAGFFTCWAVGGELTTVGALFWRAALGFWGHVGLGVLLVTAAGFVAAYAWRSIAWLARGVADSPPQPGSAQANLQLVAPAAADDSIPTAQIVISSPRPRRAAIL